MMMTSRGKIQRVAAKDVSVIGRNTQGVRIMSMDEGDTLIAIVRVPSEAVGDGNSEVDEAAPPVDLPTLDTPSSDQPSTDELPPTE